MNMIKFRQCLQNFIGDSGISQAKLSRETGVSQAQISRWLKEGGHQYTENARTVLAYINDYRPPELSDQPAEHSQGGGVTMHQLVELGNDLTRWASQITVNQSRVHGAKLQLTDNAEVRRENKNNLSRIKELEREIEALKQHIRDQAIPMERLTDPLDTLFTDPVGGDDGE